MPSEWITHKGKRIFYADLAGMDNAALKIGLEQLVAVALQQPPHSMATLLDLRGTRINATAMALFRDCIKRTNGYGTKNVILMASVSATTRYLFDQTAAFVADADTRLFDDFEQAKDWLAQE